MNEKLSIIKRATDKVCWDKSINYSPDDISNIKIYNLRHDKSLNSIPSPLARMHLFEAAFELLDKDESNNTNNSGDIFKKLVSDCFDIFELIYNWNNHLKDGKDLKIIKWNIEGEIEYLKNSVPKHKLLGETLEVFLKDDSFKNCSDILIITLNNKVLAGTSPFTGFFTTPNEIKDFILFNPLTGRNYFSKIYPFKDRSNEIKKFIYEFFENPILQSTTQIIRNYLTKYSSEIKGNIKFNLEELNSESNNIFGGKLKSSSKNTMLNYFEDYLIKVNYRINDDCFHSMKFDDNNRSYDYLLPLTESFFKDFNIKDISSKVNIVKKAGDSVEVSIQGENEIFKKEYHKTKINNQDGKIIDLYNDFNLKINIGIFPFIKVINEVTPFNDYYKVLFAFQDNNYTFNNEDFKLSFSIADTFVRPPTDNNFRTSVFHRTISERDKSPAGSSYYSLKGKENRNVCFDMIEITFPKSMGENIKAIIVPNWIETKQGEKQIDYAVDFGTTSTFISYTDDPNYTSTPKPFSLGNEGTEKNIPVEFLNKPKNKTADLQYIDCYELSLQDFIESIEIQKQEFVPSILNSEKYSLPFRSVIYQKNGVNLNSMSLFENTNIGFLYQKQTNFVTHMNQEYITNLKWNIKSESRYENIINIFIEELFYLMRVKTIYLKGDPSKTRLTWFSPLSFTPAAEYSYSKIWNDLFKTIFNSNEVGNIRRVTESEAPFYYYSKSASINNENSVLTIDIGGGTTDVMFIENKIPKYCTSVHFGANILWGNGFSEFNNSKENGVYNNYKETINKRLNSTELKSLNEEYNKSDSVYGSDEIVNFWIYNDKFSNILNDLSKGKFKLSYLLHISSLIYHVFTLLYKQDSNMKSPASIIFSGNGSKYIDLIQSKEIIGKLCDYFSEKIFGSNFIKAQIILPEKDRKEASCYGGLYMPFNTSGSFKSVNFMGFENQNEEIKKYSDFDLKREEYFDRLIDSFSNFIELFFDINNNSELTFRDHFDIDMDLKLMKSYILEKGRENLELGYSKRRSKVNAGDQITDSIFFYPFIGLIYQINKLSQSEISNLISKKLKKYIVSYDISEGFSFNRMTNEKKPDSIFVIQYEDENSTTADLKIIENPEVYRNALNSVPLYLKPVCDWSEFPTQETKSLRVIKPGEVEKKNNGWFIKEKIKIEFI